MKGGIKSNREGISHIKESLARIETILKPPVAEPIDAGSYSVTLRGRFTKQQGITLGSIVVAVLAIIKASGLVG